VQARQIFAISSFVKFSLEEIKQKLSYEEMKKVVSSLDLHENIHDAPNIGNFVFEDSSINWENSVNDLEQTFD
jgi:hypothetical protein